MDDLVTLGSRLPITSGADLFGNRRADLRGGGASAEIASPYPAIDHRCHRLLDLRSGIIEAERGPQHHRHREDGADRICPALTGDVRSAPVDRLIEPEPA